MREEYAINILWLYCKNDGPRIFMFTCTLDLNPADLHAIGIKVNLLQNSHIFLIRGLAASHKASHKLLQVLGKMQVYVIPSRKSSVHILFFS